MFKGRVSPKDGPPHIPTSIGQIPFRQSPSKVYYTSDRTESFLPRTGKRSARMSTSRRFTPTESLLITRAMAQGNKRDFRRCEEGVPYAKTPVKHKLPVQCYRTSTNESLEQDVFRALEDAEPGYELAAMRKMKLVKRVERMKNASSMKKAAMEHRRRKQRTWQAGWGTMSLVSTYLVKSVHSGSQFLHAQWRTS